MAVDRRQIEEMLPQLRRYARGLVSDRSAADDLVQETVLKALKNEHQFMSGNLSAWLFAILTNTARSYWRSAGSHPMTNDSDPADAGSDMATRVGIVSAIGSLTTEHREALLLTAIEGFTYQEAADITGVPIGTVMSRIARARDHLAERLEGAPVVPIRRVR